KVLCQLATEEEDSAAPALMKHLGVPAKEYHLKVLKRMVTLMQESIGKSQCSQSSRNQGCSCTSIQAVSEAWVPLIKCPETSPVIGALLQQPVNCIREGLSENVLDALHSAYSRFLLITSHCSLVHSPSYPSIYTLRFSFHATTVDYLLHACNPASL
ncbi:hypothetical protein XENORESO_007287, partial [Xenotaenia resolanae]